MTFIITGAAYGSVVQVTDRLVTRRDTDEEFDSAANKNVVYLARDGLVTIAYTGLAYVEGQPTDRWLARKLAVDETLQDDGLGAIHTGFGRPSRWMDMGLAMRHLAAELTRTWQKHGYGIGQMQVLATGFQWPAAGWRWKLARSRPVIWELMSRRSRAEFTALPMERHFGWERRRITLAALPQSLIPDEDFRNLARDLGVAESPEEIIGRMVASVQEVSSHQELVGSDCMCIHLPSPRLSRTVTCRYVPTSRTSGAKSKSAFTPWLVAPDMVVAPAIVNGFTLEVPSGPFNFKFEGPQHLQISPDGRITVVQSQPRPPVPNR